MKIRFTGKQENGKNLGHEKEVVHTRNLIAFYDNQFKELAVCRWYMGRASNANRVYCSIWVNHEVLGEYTAGHGTSQGYGFCKHSDAFEHAINSAGIYSSEPISGRGMNDVDLFLEELAKQNGFLNVYVAKG